MKNFTLTTLILLIFSTSLLFTSFTYPTGNVDQTRENTPGTLTFTVKTVTQGGSFAPRHVLAIWVEHNGEFVKTRLARANQRKQYLYTWKAASNYNVTDAITGATLTSHQTHTVEWDCTDLNGDVVADGTYTMWIEFTEKHAQGPLFNIDFEKGPDGFDVTPPDETYFKNIQLTWEPEVVLTADFTSDVQETCTNQTVTFTDNSSGATTWDWDFGEGANPATANTQGPHEVVYSTSGSKTVSLTIDQGITQTKTDYITIDPDAVAGYTWTQQSRTITFTNTSENAASYEWDFGDGNTSTETDPVHTYAEDGTYEVKLNAVSDMCANNEYIEEIVINTVGISSPRSVSDIRVFPNPGNGIFHVSVPFDLSNVDVNIFDVRGNIVCKQCFNQIGQHDEITVGNSELHPGLYFIEIKSDSHTSRTRLLVK